MFGDNAESPSETKPLYYTALLAKKPDANAAIKSLFAQIREIVIRLHSDGGGEFVNQDMTAWCCDH